MKEGLPIAYRWRLRTGSARELIWNLHTFLVDTGYEHNYEALKLEPSPIGDTATFSHKLEGRKVSHRLNALRLLIGIGLLFPAIAMFTLIIGGWWKANAANTTDLVIGILAGICFLVGLIIISTSRSTRKAVIAFQVEGETYRASAHAEETGVGKEVLSTVSDIRIILTAEVGRLEHGEIKGPSTERAEWEVLKRQLEGLKHQVDDLLPRIALPEVKK